MNSKAIFKRTMPLIIALAVVIIIAVSCTVFARDKTVPTLTDPDGVFLTSGDITITKGKIYEDLKSQIGIESLVDMLDKHLLDNEMNDEGDSFYQAVTAEQIAERIEKRMFPQGRSGDEDDDNEIIANWERTMFLSHGLRTQQARDNHFRLVLAREQYVRYILEKEYLESLDSDDESTILERDITSFYDNNYRNSYWTIVVPYNTLREGTDALSQLGIKVVKDDNNRDVWAWGANDDLLTEEEVKQAFIDLYNNAYSYRAVGYPNQGNPTENRIVRQGVQYTIEEGKIAFNIDYVEQDDEKQPQENDNLFYYKTADLNKYNSNMASYVRGLEAYLAEGSTFNRTYSPNPRTWSGANNYYLVFKIQFEEPEELDDVRDDIIESILNNRVAGQQTNKLSQLRTKYREESGFVIYDPILESRYIATRDNNHPTTKQTSTTDVAKLGELVITADQLFEELARRHGVLVSIDLFNYEYMLYSNYNTIYEYRGKDQQGEILDQGEWNDILNQIDMTRRAFSTNAFATYGYPSNYGWTNFLREFYASQYGVMVENENDLKMFFLYQRVVQEFAENISETTEEVWETIYLPAMQKRYNEFLSAQGMHLLIHKIDDQGKTVNPEDWTEYETQLAKELYDKVITELETVRPSRYQEFLQTTISNKFENAPRFVANLEQSIENQPKWTPATDWINPDEADYEYSKYKTAGLRVRFEQLSSITAGQMVEPFENAVRQIWNDAEVDGFGETPIIYDKNYGDYLVTEFGFHVYINTRTTNRPTAIESNETVVAPIPTLKQIQLYEEDELHGDLTIVIKRGITTYYTPIRNELVGSTYYQLRSMQLLLEKANEITFADTALNADQELETVLEFYIENYYSSLKHVPKPDVNGE